MIPEYSLDGKIALITGAGRGIGTGIAEVLAEAGATVVLNALTDKYLGPYIAEHERRTGRKMIGITGDVTGSAGADELVRKTTEQVGPIDIMVNNLGNSIRRAFVALPDEDQKVRISDEEIHKIMDLNLISAIFCTRAVGPGMIERRRGKVIQIASFAAVTGTPYASIYSVGKTGLLGLTRSLALEWAKFGINVNAIAPGSFPDVVTAGEEGVRRTEERSKTQVPLGRTGKLREVGLLALYLASDASNYMTGQMLSLDGGTTI